MKLHVKVTQDDILSGVRCDPLGCPIQRATQRAIKETTGKRQVVGVADMLFFYDEEMTNRVSVEIPTSALEFIEKFDSWQNPAPIEFEIEYDPTTAFVENWDELIAV